MTSGQGTRARLSVAQVEPIGGHRGMHYYDLQLCHALVEQGVQPFLFTSDETPVGAFPDVAVRQAFRNVFGKGHILKRGLCYVRGLYSIWRATSTLSPAIFHFHYFLIPPLDYLFIRGAKARGASIVMTAHDVVPFDGRGTSLLGRIYAIADRIIVHAESNRDELISRYGIPDDRVAVIPHGNYMGHIDSLPDQAEAKKRLGISCHEPMILFFGQIKRVKGLDYLLRAMPPILDRHPDAKLVIAGAVWKDDWARYEHLIDELGIQDHVVTRIEHIPDQDVPYYFCGADVVALPYLKIYQSGVLLMALSYGRPVVATATGGMAEVVQHGQTGYLVPPADTVALTRAISDTLASKEKAEEMGRAARALAEDRYSWSRIAATTKATYVDALAQRNRSLRKGGS